MILNATSLLHQTSNPTEEQIVKAMDGNICRCGSHPRILEAVKRVARPQPKGETR
jgi:aerobic-type carbon monoxide dehydrogenase small subunit (CoxS/CutS family)